MLASACAFFTTAQPEGASMMSGFKNRIAPTLAALVMATSASVALTQPAVASDNVDNSSHKSMSENAR